MNLRGKQKVHNLYLAKKKRQQKRREKYPTGYKPGTEPEKSVVNYSPASLDQLRKEIFGL